MAWKEWADHLLKSKKGTYKQAHGAIQRAKDHAQAAADGIASIGGKALADLVVNHKSEAEATAARAAAETKDDDLVFELEDDDPTLIEIDNQALAAAIGSLVANEMGAQVRAALTNAQGRLD